MRTPLTRAGMVGASAVGDRVASKKPLLMSLYVVSSVIFLFIVTDVNGTFVANDAAVRGARLAGRCLGISSDLI